MNSSTLSSTYYIGWDVGGWSCDKNAKSRDAIVILDGNLSIVGKPWRGNLRECIAMAGTTRAWLMALFEKCKEEVPEGPVSVTMAIDTPLGFSDEFVGLITRQSWVEPDETSGMNRYLFRQTERHLFDRGLRPLSAIKDMIGSQATKGMHALAKFAPQIVSCGVWSDSKSLTAIEAYPSPCKLSPTITTMRTNYPTMGHEDKEDALTCALIAFLFDQDRKTLASPVSNMPDSEGWIWLPNDVLHINERNGV